MERDLPLIPTHVAGLDAALGGGIPAGAIVLVAGTPGTMKSSLIYNMMYHNAKARRRRPYIGLTTFLVTETAIGSAKVTQYGEDFLADGIIHLRHVEVGETDVQLRLRCVKMRMMNHVHNSMALTHGDDGFAVTHILARKK